MIESALEFIPLANNSYWSINFTYAQLAGSSAVYDSYSMAILDTGTTLTYLSYNAYWSFAIQFEN